MKPFTFKTKYAEYQNCYFHPNTYHTTGNKALSIYNRENGTICVCTVNGSRILKSDEIGIKNWSENEGIDKFLIEMGIVEDKPFDYESIGFVEIPYYKLTEKGLNIFNVKRL